MGWTYDYGDAARNRRSAEGPGTHDSDGLRGRGHADSEQGIGIPRILRRRARWMSARLRHTRH
ncbi:hypothetical protein [Streptomyces clavuligerus]|uniref:Uncharacterized protein n=1 Tax=Streptomyces clavuligerus TaxID=1901 RepID=B5GY00_STRCL|nr:hypothetical protein [Streptomyces clavuligerus]ANW19558.1 hypothetical protein BB341_15700 [Streptomyces clavuligerus]AXU14164.1 hypothetical protein D1794_16370 [Streptomyces clavuligerus]EDY51196.1 hypothetical protein SSCG_04280 [Streptomyces clavuligerus]EFG07632.1 Hypothetical protein SCLAV_2560 [Streptomyces clavuligerus]MBY6304159.1 hypothetical protein [Streptomyces clavuligerus]